MQRFCPLCSKNGIKAEIKIFQLNRNEATFLCSSTECPWPVGYQELTVINRSICEDWSEHREKVAWENSNNCPQVDKTVPDQSPDVLPEDNCCMVEEDSTTLSKPCDLILDTNIDSESNLASQPVDLEPINTEAGASITNNNVSNNTPTVVYVEPPTTQHLANVEVIVNGISIPLEPHSNFVPVKTASSNNLSRVSKVSKDLSRIKPNVGRSPRRLIRSMKKDPSKKMFNIHDLQKAKSTNVVKVTNLSLVARNKESSKEKENFNETNRTLNNGENRVDFDLTSSWNKESSKEKENFNETNKMLNNGENRVDFDLNSISYEESSKEKENFNETNKTLNNGENRVDFDLNSIWNEESSREKENFNETNRTLNNGENQFDFDSNSSSNNESDNSETVKNSESDLNYDEIANRIRNDISGKPDAVEPVEWLDDFDLGF